MYQLLISNYEEKQQELRVENNDLRECLVYMQKELSAILNNTDFSNSVIKVNSMNDSFDFTINLPGHVSQLVASLIADPGVVSYFC